jgi:hypothetical protein
LIVGIGKDLQSGMDTEVPVGRAAVREAARAAAKAAGGWSFKGGVVAYCKVSEIREAERGLTFAISALNGRQAMQFRVLDKQITPARSIVSVSIGEHLEMQARTTLGVPVDRRRLAGYGNYVRFLEAFSQQLENLATRPGR